MSEAVDARITLSSAHGKRVYLLEGAGTGGRKIDSAVVSTSSSASFWEALQPGTYTIETAAYSPKREGEFWLSIDSMAVTPAASCVISLGTLAAGSVTTEAGSWDRDDGCRSTNATTSQATRYYARYFSFTVSEAVDARITLTSNSQARLYLLDGDGTGGGLVVSAGHSRSMSNPSLRRVLQPGTYTLETAARSARVEADFTLSISLAMRAPTRGDALEAQEIQARLAAAQVDMSGAFNGTVESYAATSSNESIVTTSVNGSVVTLNGVTVGTATVTVTATNAAGSTTQSFAVTVIPVTAPQATGALAAQTVTAAASIDVDVAAAFTGTVDTYSATSSDTAVLAVSTSGSKITLTGVTEGRATVTVTAANTGGNAIQSLAVTVNAPAPRATDTIAAQTVTARDSVEVDVAAAFTGTVDTYSATSSDTAVVTVSSSGSKITLTGVTEGRATVTVTAANTAGRATQTIVVTINPPVPRATGTVAAQTVTAGDSVEVDVAAAFTGTVDTYSATSSDTAVVTVSTSGSKITLIGVVAGTATVTVSATNTGGSATQTVDVTVAPAAPTATGTLAAQTVTAGDSVTVDVVGAFSGTVDTYAAMSSNGAVLDIALAGSVVTLTGVVAGTATVTVTATNTTGSATQTIVVTVNLPPAPTLGAQLAAQTLQVTEVLAVDVAAGFNGRIDTYTAVSGDTDTLTVTVDGSAVTLTGVAVGSTTVTVTAINAAGRAARSFAVTVNALTAPQVAATPVAQTLTAGEELRVDVTDAFTGIVATYTATSNNTTVATATTDGSTVILTGVAAGTATVTATATNSAGSVSQDFAVTVVLPAAPTVALVLADVPVTVGRPASVDLAGAFAGTVDSYTATSGDTTKLTVSTSGAKLTLTGVAAGSATVTVTASNLGGSVSQDFTATVGEAGALEVALSVSAFCVGSEGIVVWERDADSGEVVTRRRDVGSVEVTYAIFGGVAPYTVTSPLAPGASRDTVVGSFTMGCEQPGVDLDNVGADVNVVEAGPRTITVAVTDGAGTTVSAEAVIEIAESAYTSAYHGGTMRPGRSYVLGEAPPHVIMTVPTGLELRFAGLSDDSVARFDDTRTEATVYLDWRTGAELRRHIPTNSNSGAQVARSVKQADTARISITQDTERAFNALTTLNVKVGVGGYEDDFGAIQYTWRPYAGLPGVTAVAVHPKIIRGDSLTVCNATAASGVVDKDRTAIGQTESDKIITDAMSNWNNHRVTASVTGMHQFFSFGDGHTTIQPCSDEGGFDIRFAIQNPSKFKESCTTTGSRGCADRQVKGGVVPRITGENIYVKADIFDVYKDGDGSTKIVEHRTPTHELGHFLGLGDYKWRSCPDDDDNKASLFVYEARKGERGKNDKACWSESITTHDLDDLYEIYIPKAREGVMLDFDDHGASTASSRGRWVLDPGLPPRDRGIDEKEDEKKQVDNAYGYVVLERSVAADPMKVSATVLARLVTFSVDRRVDDLDDIVALSGPALVGKEFFLVGFGRGDLPGAGYPPPDDSPAGSYPMTKNNRVVVDGKTWTLGAADVVYGPPAKVPVGDFSVRHGPGSFELTVEIANVPRGVTKYRAYFEPVSDSATQDSLVPFPGAERSVVLEGPAADGSFSGVLRVGRGSRVAVRVLALNDVGVEYFAEGKYFADSLSHQGDNPYPSLLSDAQFITAVPKLPAPDFRGHEVHLDSQAPEFADVRLVWSRVAGATGYTVYWSEWESFEPSDAGVSERRIESGATTTTTISKLKRGATYYFRVRAWNQIDGELSAPLKIEVSGTEVAPVLAAPERLTAKAGVESVTLNWSGVAGDPTFVVYWSTTGIADDYDESTSPDVVIPSLGNLTDSTVTLTVADNDLVVGTLYYFRVRAVGDAVKSALSEQVTATPIAPADSPSGDDAKPDDSEESDGDDSEAGDGGEAPSPERRKRVVVSCPVVAGVDDFVMSEVFLPGPGFVNVCRGTLREDAVLVEESECPSVGGVQLVSSDESAGVCSATVQVAAIEETVYSCPEGYEPAWDESETDPQRDCEQTLTRPATPSTEYYCPQGYSLSETTVESVVVRSCTKTVTIDASSRTVYECPLGYALSGRSCSRTLTRSVRSRTVHSCPSGYTLSTTYRLGTAVSRCTKTIDASSRTVYECPLGYALSGRSCSRTLTRSVRTRPVYSCDAGYTLSTTYLLGTAVRRCTKTIDASVSYSCAATYTLSDTSCYKYRYTKPVRGRCPAGYRGVYAGLLGLVNCRKKVTIAATASYSCPAGYSLSGTTCTKTRSPNTSTKYYCDTGYTLRWVDILTTPRRSCQKTETTPATPVVEYDCATGYDLSGTTCTKTRSPNTSTEHYCDTGYTLRWVDILSTPRRSCEKTETTPATPVVEYDCATGYDLSGTTCTKRTTTGVLSRIVHVCAGDYTPTAADDTTCEKLETTAATSRIERRCADSTAAPRAHYAGIGIVHWRCDETITRPEEVVHVPTCTTAGYTPDPTTTGTADRCTKPITRAAITRTVITYSCPTGYEHHETITGATIEHACRPATTP